MQIIINTNVVQCIHSLSTSFLSEIFTNNYLVSDELLNFLCSAAVRYGAVSSLFPSVV